MTYAEKRKDVRWQKRRLQIMGRAKFRCEECERHEGITLTVHHILYIPGRDPWDYPDVLLECLCDECHEVRQKVQTEILTNVASVLRDLRLPELRCQPAFTFFEGLIR